MSNLIDIRGLSVEFRTQAGPVQAIHGLDLRIRPGSTVALVGESGSGKSVTAQTIMGILPRTARIVRGQILMREPDKPDPPVDLAALDPASDQYRAIRGNRISMIFQEPMTSLSPLHTIGNQISEALFLHRRMSRADGLRATVDMLDMVGFPHPRRAYDTYPFELSGGLRQRAMIAMALICHPALLIADEPSTALDVTIQAQILKLIQDLQAELQMALLIITHDLGVVANVAEEVVVMYNGRVVESGTLREIYGDPRHPYLKALLKAVPHFDMKPGERLTPLREIGRGAGRRLMENGGGKPLAAATTDPPLLQVRHLSKRFTNRKQSGLFRTGREATQLAVDDVSFSVPRGSCLGLVGESGCGKTTVSKLVMRAIEPDAGTVTYNGEDGPIDVLALEGKALTRFRRRIQYVFQDPFGSLNPRMPVLDIVSEPLVIHDIGDRAYRREMVVELMELVGLEKTHLNRYPHSFSGGQRQRIGIARALALRPELLICDEPVSALDVSVQAQILNLLKDLQAALGLTYLFISHNLAVVDYMADHIAVMCAGRLVELAPREALFRNPVHPYTRALLAAVPYPDPDRRLDFAALMDGRASDPEAWPPPFNVDAGAMAGLFDLGDGHCVRAHSAPPPPRTWYDEAKQQGTTATAGRPRHMIRLLRVLRRYGFAALGAVVLWMSTGFAAAAAEEPPVLAERVAAGELPAMAERLPQTPSVVPFAALGKIPGRYGGGELRTLMGREQDTRMLVVYGYARLVGYQPDWTLQPDILESVDVEEERRFTFHLRPGHKWSDGQPFTAEDFRYYWEDVLTNEEMSPGGLPAFLRVDGAGPRFEVVDETTVRYTWDKPNLYFLPTLAGARPEYLYQPAHYLKQFHARYAEPEALARRVAEGGQRNWVALHFRKAQQYKNDDPDLPTLQPWRILTRPPSNRFVFERNPYYYRVDPDGRQLPYIDTVAVAVVSAKLIPAKAAAGETDLQARGLGFENYAILKQGEERHNYTVALWPSAAGSEIALYPNLTAAHPVWRDVLRNADVRRALSLAIDRDEINQTIYYGLADVGGNTVLPDSPLFKPDYPARWTDFDLERANEMLDAVGLTRQGDGLRQLPDGRPMDIVVETAGESATEIDVLQLVRDSWAQIGIRMHIKPLQREVFRNRIFAGATVMSVWKGLENALPTPVMAPHELAPTNQMQLQWPQWGQYAETSGQAGQAVDLEPALALANLHRAWEAAPDVESKTAIWQEMLDIYSDQVFSIGIVRAVPQPVVISNRLQNVPKTGVYNWEPGAHFGIHRPDTFWFQ